MPIVLSALAKLQAAQARDGGARGKALWKDLQESNDPEAPTTTDTPFPYQTSSTVNPRSVAMPDPGSVQPYDPIATVPASSAGAGSLDPGQQLDPG